MFETDKSAPCGHRRRGQYIQSGRASKRASSAGDARRARFRFRWVFLTLALWSATVAWGRADAVLETPRVRILHVPTLEHRAVQIADMTPELMGRLENKLGLPFDLRPTVVPAPDRAAFRRLGGKAWFTAFAAPHKDLVVLDLSRLDQQPGDLYATLKHEYAHLLLHHAIDRRRLPRWLDEGVAQWVSDGWSEYLPEARNTLLPQAAAAGRLFFLDDLAGRFPADRQGIQLAYEQSRSFVNYLVRHFGEAALRALLQALAAGSAPREAFEEVLGADLDTVEDEWRTGLHKPASWMASLAGHVYGLLFFGAAVATIWGYLRLRHRQRHYRAGEEDDFEA